MITQKNIKDKVLGKSQLLKSKIGLKLVRIGRLTRAHGRQCFSSVNAKITPEQFGVLTALIENDGMYQRQIGHLTLKDRPNMTRIIKILETKGLITRKEDVNKRKIYKLFITEEGKKVHADILPTVFKVWNTCIGDISDEEIQVFISTLNKIRGNLEKEVILQT